MRKDKIFIVALFLVWMTGFLQSAPITSLLSWSTVPEPAHTWLDYIGLMSIILNFPILFLFFKLFKDE